MNKHYLASLFTPESIALYGASDREDSVGGIVFKNLITSGFKGRIYAINPKRDVVQGEKAFSSLDEIEELVDLVVVATPASSIPAIVEACGERGVKMMLILSAGFRETGAEGRKLEDRVTQLIKRYDIRLMGPNCLGLIRPDKGLNITFGNNNARPGNLAFVSQSGAICTAILDWAEANDIGFSAVVSTGIAADLDFGDYLDYLVSDPHTKAILLYIEGINNSRRCRGIDVPHGRPRGQRRDVLCGAVAFRCATGRNDRPAFRGSQGAFFPALSRGIRASCDHHQRWWPRRHGRRPGNGPGH